MSVRLGTSGFLYDHWRGSFYPPSVRAAELEYYASRFEAVELNVTFYRMPSSATFRAWAARVPDGFVYAIKASRYLTHVRRLRDPRDAVEYLMERASELGSHLGPVLLQLPPDLPADPAAPVRPPAPPAPPPSAARPMSVPPTEAELFRRKSLDELNAERPLNDVFFDYDLNTLRDDARRVLQQIAQWLSKWPQTMVLVDGHCDERGTAEYNLALGDRRAAIIREYLTNLGVRSDRIQIRSLGKEAPFCRDSGESCWSQNRRDHFVIVSK